LAADGLRRLMAHWATGVSVLTSQLEDREPRGCTANAVTSLSLDPLLVLACFDLGSNTLEAVRRTGRFGVNILAHDQEEVSRRFAGKGQRKFEGLAHHVIEGVPIIDGALAWMACEVREEMEGGDHAIVIGAPLLGDVREDAHPLVFFRRRYGRVAA
jgi:3-hydroxy-9,10-secoandrosta-1,3,5(10)-triene-9,17-dione monooxygenase reductase component